MLILASLLASLRATAERKYRRPLIVGAALAFAASAATWWLADRLLAQLLPLGGTPGSHCLSDRNRRASAYHQLVLPSGLLDRLDGEFSCPQAKSDRWHTHGDD